MTSPESRVLPVRSDNWLYRTVVRITVLLTLAVAVAAQAGAQLPDPNQGPGGPILVITSPSPFSRYYAELLRTEGLNEFAVLDISAVTAATLSAYDVAILAPTALTAAQVTMFTDWVNVGGNLIAMAPDAQLGSLLGVTATAGTLSDAYLLVDTSTGPGNGIVSQVMQFHGTAKIYTLAGASRIATLYTNATTATTNPAVTLRTVGTNGGHAAAFAYDLATSIVYTRQGKPAWAAQERDGFSPIRSDDKFFGAAAADPQPDWVDLNNVLTIPQADEQQRLLANLIVRMNLAKKPLPRFWYLPFGKRAAVVMSGDDHGNGGTAGRFEQQIAASPAGCNVANWECVRSTSYMFVQPDNLSNAQAISYTAQGFEVGLHINTDCGDFTPASLDTIYNQQVANFRTSYPGIPAPVTMRHHCIVWSDWATGATTQLRYGIRLDSSYYFWPPGWVQNRPGHFTGSAMPMRFADLDGSLIDVYNVPTQMTDESGQSYPFTSDTLLNAAVGPQGYYGVYTVNSHTDAATNPVSDAVVPSALRLGVPVVSTAQMLTWLDGRNSSSFGSLVWNGAALSFTVTPGAGATGLQAMVPAQSVNGVLTGISGPGGVPVTLRNDIIKGVSYAFFTAVAGTYTATYTTDNTPPAVTAKSPASGATGVAQSATVSATFSEPIEPGTVNSNTVVLRDSANALVPASVTYDASARTAVLTPASSLASLASYTATITTGVKDLFGNALAANNTWSFSTAAAPSCPCTGLGSSGVPAVVSVNDPNAVELGVKFTVDLDGVIAGIRFYKGASNTGTHTGNLWSNTGQLLAAATFSNESASGWQQVMFSAPVAVRANTVYVASYHTTSGNYSATSAQFASAGVDSPPVHLLRDGVSGGNGLYAYSGTSTFPTNSYQSTNYWVDVVFSAGGSSTPGPLAVISTSPTSAATGVSPTAPVTVTFNNDLLASSVTASSFVLRNAANTLVPGTYSVTGKTATFTPGTSLAASTGYTATLTTDIRDANGTALTSPYTFSFTTSAGATSGGPEAGGWFSGDMHVHRSCGGAPESLSAMLDRMTPQNLSVISLLADMGNAEVQNATTDLPLVNGQDSPISTAGRIVHWDTEWHWDAIYTQYPHQALGGHLVALGLTQAQQIWQESTYPILNWARQQGAIAGFAHLQYLDGGIPQSLSCCTPIEYPVEVALGAADFISEDVDDSDSRLAMQPDNFIQAYYKLLNTGFRPGFAAGTDYPCNAGRDLGSLLTYVQVPGQLTYRGWIDGIARGRTVVSRNGHREFLDLRVNGTATPGDEIRLASPGSVPVSVQWTATQNFSGTLELVSNGVVVATQAASVTAGAPVTLSVSVSFPRSGWIAARRMGADGHQVHTAAVFVIVNNAPIRTSVTDAQFFVQWMDNLLTKTAPGGPWNSFFPTSLSAAQARYQAAKTVFQQISAEAAGSTPVMSVITTAPANGATGVAPSTAVTVTFPNQPDTTTINASTFTVSNGGTPVAGSYSVNANTATFTPSAPFSSGVTYTAALTTGVKDIYGNALPAAYSWTFTISGSNTPACTSNCTIWPASAVPALVDGGSDNPVQLGVRFRSDVSGRITGIRFYKASTNTGTHVGSLWSAAGQLLASGTFINETASGWQQVIFQTPVAITANTVYVASYHVPNGHYSADLDGFAAAGVDSPPLHALRDGDSGANAVYGYGPATTFPTQTFRSTNYWVDVVFSSSAGDTTPPVISAVAATPASTGATISWTTDEASDSVVLYGTQPASLTQTGTAAAGVTAHSVSLTGLNPATTYYYQVRSTDQAGNAATSSPATFITSAAQTWSITGSVTATGSGATITLGGASTGTATADASGNFSFTGLVDGNYTITPTKAGVTFTPASRTIIINGGGQTASFTAASTCTSNCTIWPASAVPGLVDGGSDNPVQLGVRFRSDVSGTVTGIRFYKASTNTGTHVGSLWSAAGQLLASATFINETASGWQQVVFSTPVAITANTVYVASYHVPGGHYSADLDGFAAAGVDSPPLHALRDGESGSNSVYGYGPATTFPTQTFRSTNYWVDVVFSSSVTDTTPPVISAVAANPASTGATISWTTDEASDSVVLYGTQPASLTQTGTGAAGVTAHSVSLTGLIPATTYYYQVRSTDQAGNAATSSPATFITSAAQTWSITGSVTATGSGATITLGGASTGTATADASGNFSFTGLVDGNYTITPTKAGVSFTPASRTIIINGGDQSASFTAAAQTWSITGSVTATGSGATITLGGASTGTATADGSGNFSFTGLANGTYTITPAKAGVTFTPASRTVTVNGADQTASFTAAAQTWSITGSVTATGSGATITLGGASTGTVTADGSGNFSFTGLANGTYTITPAKAGVTFTPASRTVTVNGADQTASFTAAAQTWSITGSVTASGSGATLTLSGASTGTATADASGNFSFTGLANGTYTITPTKAGVTFTPTSRTLTISGANQTTSFTAVVQTWSLTGSVTATGSGATLTLSGASTGTATANASGNFSFTGLANGTYTVTPAKAGFAFTPASRTVTINGANQTASFTAAAVDTTPPVITSVASAPLATSARITWTTNELSDSRVTFGTSAGALTLSASDAALVTAHTVTLTGLTQATTYYFRVGSTDASGNAATFPIPANAPLTFSTSRNVKIFPDTSVPAVPLSSSTGGIEVGMRFRSEVAGTVTAIRFYKGGTANSGTHVGHLWTSTGTLLGTATFANETSSGWQQADLQTPVAISSGVTYVASYYAPAGRYSTTSSFFDTTGVYQPPLYALPDGFDGANGVFRSGTSSGFPTQTSGSTNYWVDVVVATPSGPVTSYPSSTTILTGTLRSGTSGQLASDDEAFYELNSTTSGLSRTTSWYGSFTDIPNTVTSLKVAYAGKNSRSTTETVSIWNWSTNAWVQLSSSSVGTSEVLRSNLTPSGTLTNYISGNTGTGTVRVRIEATALLANFNSSADLLAVTYQP